MAAASSLSISRSRRSATIKAKSFTLVTSCFDITERVEAHAELRQKAAQDLRAQRLASIGTLAGGIAHDLNNVLAPIVMSIDLLSASVTSDDDRVLVDAISTSARRGADMVRQVLSFARGMQAERTQIRPGALLADVEKTLRGLFPGNFAVRSECVGEPWPIPRRIRPSSTRS